MDRAPRQQFPGLFLRCTRLRIKAVQTRRCVKTNDQTPQEARRAVLVFSRPLHKPGRPAGQEGPAALTTPSSARNARLAGSCISQTCEHVGRRRQLAFWVTIALLFCAYSHCGPFLYEYIQAPTDLAEQMLSGNSTTSYSNLVFKLFTNPICNR